MKTNMAARSLFGLLIVIGLLTACNGGATGTTTTTTISPGTSTPTTTTSTLTFGQLAQPGRDVYASYCASCHGTNGEGGIAPRIVGNPNIPIAYNTAARFLNKISGTMPQNNPNSLTTTQYQQVLSYLLLENGWVQSGAIYDSEGLAQIPLG